MMYPLGVGRVVSHHYLRRAHKVLDLALDQLDGRLEVLERLRRHRDGGERVAVVTLSCVQLTLELVQLSMDL